MPMPDMCIDGVPLDEMEVVQLVIETVDVRETDPLPPLPDTELDESLPCCGVAYPTHAAWHAHYKATHRQAY